MLGVVNHIGRYDLAHNEISFRLITAKPANGRNNDAVGIHLGLGSDEIRGVYPI